MRMRMGAILVLPLLSTAAFAQQPAQPDLATVLNAIQSLAGKVDSLQQDVERLKTATPPASQPVASTAAQPATSQDPPPSGGLSLPAQRYEPGWVVSVMPMPLEGQSPESIGAFIAAPGGFTFSDFRKTVRSNDWSSFVGEAWFDAKESGRYVFTFSIETSYSPSSNRDFICEGDAIVAGKEIIAERSQIVKAELNTRPFSRGIFGAADLERGAYEIRFSVSCYIYYDGKNVTDDYFINRNDPPDYDYRKWFDTIKFHVQVRGPGDMISRAPAANELVHVAVGKPSSASAAPIGEAAAGETKRLVDTVNVRMSPTTDSMVGRTLAAGQAVQIVRVVSGSTAPSEEWAEVSFNGGRGYIKLSALLANSQ